MRSAVKSLTTWADRDGVRRSLVLIGLTAVLIAGCQSSGTGVYDEQAKDEARRVAGKDLFSGYGEDTSVGSVHETSDCPQAPSEHNGPCLAMEVTTNVPVRDAAGPTGQKVRVALDAFVWLKRNSAGRWVVTDKMHRPSGASITR